VPERVGSKVLPILNKSLLAHLCQEEALSEQQEPPRMHAGEVSVFLFTRWPIVATKHIWFRIGTVIH
jgi:hypothetical protein